MADRVRATPETGSPAGARAGTGLGLPGLAGGYAVLCGITTLVGWWAEIPRLTSWEGNGIAMMPNAAAAAMAGGVALLLSRWPGRGARAGAIGLGVLVGLIGAATLAEHITGVDAGIDTLLIKREWGQLGTVSPGRMGPPASVSFMLTGMAVVLLGLGARARRVASAAGIAVAAIALLSLTGYLYGANPLFAAPRLTAIAIQTATTLLALGVALVAAAPDAEPMRTLRADTAAAVLVRRAMPPVVLIPILLGWLRVTGHNMGLYDMPFGTALRTLVEVGMLMGLLWWTAGAVRAHERSLRESRAGQAALAERLRLVADALPALVSYVDAQEIYRFTNRKYHEWFGSGKLEGRRVRDVLGEETYAVVRPHVEAALSGRRVQFESRVRYPEGGFRWIHADYVPHLSAGGVQGFYALVTDITDRKRAEEALRENEARFRRMADTSPAMLWMTDESHLCTFLSRAWCEYTGQSERDRKGARWTTVIHPDDAEAAARAFREAGERGEPFSIDYRLRRADGEYRWVIDAARPRRGPSGEFQGFIGSVIDVHERKRAEEEARATAEALERSHRELERFVGIASHDLKEPLRGIATLAEFVIEDEPALSERMKSRLQRMGQLCTRLTRMVDGLLQYARSGGEARREPCDLERVARAAIDKLEEPLRAERAVVSVEGPLPTVKGDPLLLERLFANLIVNGVKHNRSEVKRVEIGRAGDQVFVRDNGVGIDARHHELVFDLFKRAPGTETDGVGLGLALVRNIVWSHGGRIRLESEPGRGTTVWMQFPGGTYAPAPPTVARALEETPSLAVQPRA